MSRYFPMDKGPRDLLTEDLAKLTTIAEGWYCEYKREMAKPISVAKSVSAFANSHGGWIFYGIEEDRETRCALSAPGIPLANLAQTEVWLRQAVSGAISPTPYYEHVFLRGPLPALGLDDQHGVLAVFVPEGINAPYLHSSGRIYRRIADESDPRNETDRQILDLLFERSKAQRKRIKRAIGKTPERSESETNAPCLRLLIFSDLWSEYEGPELGFDEFKKIMSSGTLAFDNFYTTTYGQIARLTFGNDPSRMIYSWHHRGWFEEILLPFSWFTIPTIGLPYPQFTAFHVGAAFLTYCRAAKLEGRPAIEISGLFNTIFVICQKLEAVLNATSCQRALYFKVQMSGIWRSIPFLDVPLYLEFIKANGIPVAQEDVAYGPPGAGAEYLASLKNWRRKAACNPDDADGQGAAEVLNAITILREICRCLGLPSEAWGIYGTSESELRSQVDALTEASVRSNSIARLHLGIDL